MEKPWETLFKPVKKGREYEDDIGAILDQFQTGKLYIALMIRPSKFKNYLFVII